ncbi:chaperonin 10-like protein [Fennellomyces sp. T-0311]|nr:chaperonin 10-like protein [Fennellomyces sp. T-0311]
MVPETMHALQLIQFGSPGEGLKYTQTKTPLMKDPTDLVVNVKAVGVNPAESKFRAGNIFGLKLPRTLGCDYSGIVVAKGSKVTEFDVGDAVFGCLDNLAMGPEGTYAEYIIASVKKGAIAKKPENISFEEAASTGAACLTAYQGILIHGKFPRDGSKRILVVGASGGVGAYGVQFAKAIGAKVTGICSGKNGSFVSGIGADRVIDYTNKENMAMLESEHDSYDMVLDCVGGDDYYYQLMPLLKQNGIYCTAVGPVMYIGAEKITKSTWLHVISTVLWRRWFGPRTYILIRDLPMKTLGTDISNWLSDGTIKGIIGENQIFNLKDGARAHALSDTQHAVGKIVLRV